MAARMRLLIALLLLAGCSRAPDEGPGEAAQSYCSGRLFDGSRFTVCSAKGGKVEIFSAASNGAPLRDFVRLEEELGERAQDIAFGMNAGMFDDEGRAIGLLIERGRQAKAINRKQGGGNFHMLPNGVFLVRDDGTAAVVTAGEFEPAQDIAFASQSGPMLVIDGKLHPDFEEDGQSRHLRNGVGIAPDGTPLFAISAEPVSFGKFARLFRDELKAKDALYFDGSVSALWAPADGRRDAHVPLGPMVVVFRPAETKSGA